MPICSQCSQEKARDAYTKAQLHKTGATRRCKQCVEAEGSQEAFSASARQSEIIARQQEEAVRINVMERQKRSRQDVAERTDLYERASLHQPPPPPPPPTPLSGTLRAEVQKRIRAAVASIQERGIPPDVGLDGFDTQQLAARLWQVSNNERMIWLTIPLLMGLVYGERKINDKFHFMRGEDPNTLLMWVCQYKFLGAQYGYCGGDDIVALVLAAAADVSLRISNGCNALFFAVKYTSAKCVEMLLDAGVKVDDRDFLGQTIWKNALERPDPNIINVLIDRCNRTIPVDKEVMPVLDSEEWTSAVHYTLPDNMLVTYIAMLTFTDNPTTIPISWQVVGAPKPEDLATVLVRVLQAGARFSPINWHSLDPLAIVTHIDTPLVSSRYSEPQRYTARLLGDVVYGRWMPNEIMKEVQSVNHSCSPDDTCAICLTDMEPCDNPVTLYCGHKYCLECIKSFGKAKLNGDLTHRISSVELNEAGQVRRARVRAEGTDKRCPICRRLLCGDLLDPYYNERYRSLVGLRLGIDRHEAGGKVTGGTRRGPQLLSDEQLRFECQIIVDKTEGTRESLLEELLQTMRTSSQLGFDLKDGAKTFSVKEENIRVELSISASIIYGTENKTVLHAPQWGPVVVPIQVKDVPILASLSPSSIFTVVPKAVVRTFGLKTKPITSSQFIDFSGQHVDVAEVVDEFRFYLKNIEICLNNAVVLKNEPSFVKSVQLGMDFFESALWTRCSVRLQDELYVVSDGGYTSHMFMKDQPDELRYYSRDGKICQVPFIHVRDLAGETSLPILSLPGDFSAQCGECQWCCRYFPCDGMLKYDDNNGGVSTREFRYYCDEDCKAKGMATRIC